MSQNVLGERALLERERERVIQLFLRGWHISLAAGIWEECRAIPLLNRIRRSAFV